MYPTVSVRKKTISHLLPSMLIAQLMFNTQCPSSIDTFTFKFAGRDGEASLLSGESGKRHNSGVCGS